MTDNGFSERGFPVLTRRWHNLARDRAGASAIEFALVAPILLVLLMGTAKFGIALNSYVMLTEAVADGAHYLALSRGTATPYTSTVSQVNGTASNLTVANLTITTLINGTACSTNSTCQTALNTAAGLPAKVTATYPCDLTVMGVNYLPTCTLSSSTTLMIQ
jgi:Flp pilus assembly protein TadG